MTKNYKTFIFFILSIYFISINSILIKASNINNIDDREVNASETIHSIAMSLSSNGNQLIGSVYMQANSIGNLSSTITLQKLSNGSWQNVSSWNVSGVSTRYLNKSFTYSGTSNYIYRIYVTFKATANGFTDIKNYSSSYIALK